VLSHDEAQRLLTLALREMAPDWELAGHCTELAIHDPNVWPSGVGTFGVTLRHRSSGALKVLGRRAGPEPNASFHRGVSFLVLEAYAARNVDPMRRYLEEIGLISRFFGPRPLAIFNS
jgi:hypothetical protein